MLLPETNQEDSGGAPRREETPVHNVVLPTSQTPSCWNVRAGTWLRDACATRKDPESDQIRAKQDDWPETTRKRTPLP